MQCSKDGCRANSLKSDSYCFWHSDTTAAKRKEAGRTGGSRGKRKIEPGNYQTVADIQELLVETVNELRASSSENVTGKARATGYLASCLLSCLETSALEKRIAAIESRLSI